jgi:hypothetical protein
MSRIDRLVGLVRSLAIYHAIPLRQRRLRRLYADADRQLAGDRDRRGRAGERGRFDIAVDQRAHADGDPVRRAGDVYARLAGPRPA